ncbi:MAG: hypothetical protein Phyf2KO_21680 [Phycisphaerales bacterium]
MRLVRPSRLVLASSVAALTVLSTGCAVVAVGAAGAAGGVAYTEGRERRVFAVNTDTAWDAILTAVKDRGIEITSEKRTPGSGEVTGKWGSEGQNVRVNVKAVGSGSTMISVRVGMADQSKNLELMRHIEYAMPEGTPASTAYDN